MPSSPRRSSGQDSEAQRESARAAGAGADTARPPRQENGARRVPFSRGMSVIRWMAESPEPSESFGVRQIAQGLGIAPSTAHRLLAMLEEAGVVRSEPDTGRYRFTLEFFRLNYRLSQLQYPMRDAGLQECRRLADVAGEAVYMGRFDPEGLRFMYVEYIESRNPVRYVMERFQWLPLYPGAGGVAILAFLPEAMIEEVIASDAVRKVTERTPTDPAEIRNDLEKVRSDGYVLSIGRRIVGGVGIGAPVFGPDGRPFGNLVLAIPEQRLEQINQRDLGAQVKKAAQAITSALRAGSAADITNTTDSAVTKEQMND